MGLCPYDDRYLAERKSPAFIDKPPDIRDASVCFASRCSVRRFQHHDILANQNKHVTAQSGIFDHAVIVGVTYQVGGTPLRGCAPMETPLCGLLTARSPASSAARRHGRRRWPLDRSYLPPPAPCRSARPAGRPSPRGCWPSMCRCRRCADRPGKQQPAGPQISSDHRLLW